MKIKSLSLAAFLVALGHSAAIAQTEIPTFQIDEDLENNSQEEIPVTPINLNETYDFEFTIIDEILNQAIYAPLRQESTVKESTRAAYVINREQIEAQGYRTVNEALRYFPGVFIDSSAGNRLGALSSQIIRGGNSSAQTLILLDGRPINTFNDGRFDLSSLSTSNVERIELIPGGGSTLFGSNAIAGVINIVTREPEANAGWVAEVGAEIGNLGYNRQEIAASYSEKNSAVRIAYDRTAAENDYDYDNGTFTGTRENAEADLQNINLLASTKIGDRHELRFNGIYSSKDIGVPGSIDDVSLFSSRSLTANQYSDDWLLSLELQSRLGNADDSQLTARVFADFGDLFFVNRESFIDTELDNSSVGVQVQHDWQFTENQGITYGVDYRSSDIIATSFDVVDYDENLSQGALFARYSARVSPEVDLNLGIRQDFNSLADGSFTSPSAGIKWQAGDRTALRANYARNFRVPTALDLYFPGFSNPDLSPETSNSFDIGIDQEIGDRALFRLTYFNNTIDDAINFVFDPVTFAGQPENIGKVRNQGLEAELSLQFNETLRGFVNYTMNNSKILEDNDASVIDNEVRFAGTDFFNVGLAYENRRGAYVGLFLKHVGDRVTNNTNTASLDSYTNVDIRARYPINENVNLTASWENIFDEDFEVFDNFPGVGSRFQIGVNAKFR
ncbi:TonB-dependent receptor [[Leptolyngbya] sp. PCC 7376]|uniref:TonB-dependent receptor plug domain-containing protein n=1 Tax=[Leptolyngbya] sp. PCC 7376 TaxID=111781 RepID=UPI00029F040C|nr:TonB-dependent receptor [[Leptolyngbya] sp. PCC 7376]AFY40483.1 TonB-dependent receptor [[Leptolyngbya] sp. PCC 7376]